MELKHDNWRGNTGGTPWMQRSMLWLLRVFDLRIIYAFMALIVPFYLISRKKERVAMYHYIRQRMGKNRLTAMWLTYVNQVRFGQIIVDRFAVYAGKRFKLNIVGYEHFQRLASQAEGFVQLSSHVGNYELAGYHLVAEKPINALIFSGETETVMQNRARMFRQNNIRLVPVASDMSHVFTLNNALASGEIVSMPGDRIFGSQKFVTCQFLGDEAKFPLGPFALAVQRNVPLLSVFSMKTGTRSYEVTCQPISLSDGDQELPARQRTAMLAQQFADQLAEIVRRYPLQWFNYYEFWNQ